MSEASPTDFPPRLIHADWLEGVATLRGELGPASVDLVYADPPFNTGRTQLGRAGEYADDFGSTQEFLTWLRPRLEKTLPLLKPSSSILIHVDWRTSHRVRILLDELLGEDRFVNHLIWSYGLGGSSPRRFARKHDDILFYCVDPEKYWFDPPQVPATSVRMKGRMKKATDVLSAEALNTDVLDVPSINNMALERTGYPTQKPLALLELLIGACCPPGGLVLDPCCGSGTTLAAARQTGRRSIGLDINPQAIEVAAGRHQAPGIGHQQGGKTQKADTGGRKRVSR